MENLIERSQTEITLAFGATCVEAVARRLGITYKEVYDKMKQADLFRQLIFPFYDVMHTESREVVVDRLIEVLNKG